MCGGCPFAIQIICNNLKLNLITYYIGDPVRDFQSILHVPSFFTPVSYEAPISPSIDLVPAHAI